MTKQSAYLFGVKLAMMDAGVQTPKINGAEALAAVFQRAPEIPNYEKGPTDKHPAGEPEDANYFGFSPSASFWDSLFPSGFDMQGPSATGVG